jgi:hypothetical protein
VAENYVTSILLLGVLTIFYNIHEFLHLVLLSDILARLASSYSIHRCGEHSYSPAGLRGPILYLLISTIDST